LEFGSPKGGIAAASAMALVLAFQACRTRDCHHNWLSARRQSLSGLQDAPGVYDHQSHLCQPQRASVARIVETTAPAPSFVCMQSLCKATEATTAACVSRRGKNLGSGQAFVTRRICYLPGLPTAVEPRASRMLSNSPTGCTRNPPWSQGSSRRYQRASIQSLPASGPNNSRQR